MVCSEILKLLQILHKVLSKKTILSYNIRGPPSALAEKSVKSLPPPSQGSSFMANHPRKQNKSGQRTAEEPVTKIIKVLGIEELSYQET